MSNKCKVVNRVIQPCDDIRKIWSKAWGGMEIITFKYKRTGQHRTALWIGDTHPIEANYCPMCGEYVVTNFEGLTDE